VNQNRTAYRIFIGITFICAAILVSSSASASPTKASNNALAPGCFFGDLNCYAACITYNLNQIEKQPGIYENHLLSSDIPAIKNDILNQDGPNLVRDTAGAVYGAEDFENSIYHYTYDIAFFCVAPPPSL